MKERLTTLRTIRPICRTHHHYSRGARLREIVSPVLAARPAGFAALLSAPCQRRSRTRGQRGVAVSYLERLIPSAAVAPHEVIPDHRWRRCRRVGRHRHDDVVVKTHGRAEV